MLLFYKCLSPLDEPLWDEVKSYQEFKMGNVTIAAVNSAIKCLTGWAKKKPIAYTVAAGLTPI